MKIRGVRKEVEVFAAMMEHKLKKNDHKPNFENTNLDYLLERLKGEVAELEEAIKNESWFEVMLEAADVANFACIIVWNILRNQVASHQENTTKTLVFPDCDCKVSIMEGEEVHDHHCAIREYVRANCTCNARGSLERTHTLLCHVYTTVNLNEE